MSGVVHASSVNPEVVNVNLQDIIKERKAERKLKAEHKRQIDLQRIRDMKSVTGIEPLQRFPKEIWSIIFKDLDPSDLGNVCKVHPTFRDLLEPIRLRDILFPQILKISQVEKFTNELLKSSDYSCIHLRGVSKSILKSYDSWIEDKLARRIKEIEAVEYSVYRPNSSVITLHLGDSDEREKLSKLLQSFKNEGAKRYFPRDLCVSFYVDNYDEDEGELDIERVFNEYKGNLLALLEIIGDQIWNFRFHFDEGLDVAESSSRHVYILLQRFVSLMPNLKWLEINIQLGLQEVEVDDILQQYPFPRLTSLERLSLHSPWETDGAFNVYETVIEANKHLKMIDIHEVRGTKFEDLPAELIQSLPLTWFRPCSDYLHAKITILDIQPIVNFNWPLQHIHLTLDYTGTNVSNPMSSILQFLEKFPTLETVKLKEIKGITFKKKDTFDFLKLPSLTNLDVRFIEPEIECKGNIQFFFSLQFLVLCKNLKTLKWDMRCVEDDELRKYLKKKEKKCHENAIDFRAGLRCLYESNIWDVFPSLDTVQVSIAKLKSCRCHRDTLICEQIYWRSAFVDGKVSIGRFLNSHKCSREHALQNCAMLQD